MTAPSFDDCGCEYTPSGFFAHPCTEHGCPSCGHVKHDAAECGHPDPHTGWCECDHTDSATNIHADGPICQSCHTIHRGECI